MFDSDWGLSAVLTCHHLHLSQQDGGASLSVLNLVAWSILPLRDSAASRSRQDLALPGNGEAGRIRLAMRVAGERRLVSSRHARHVDFVGPKARSVSRQIARLVDRCCAGGEKQ